jgi:AP-3 complex subunit mu
MLSSVYLTNGTGTILIEKQYRDRVPRSDVESACLSLSDPLAPPPTFVSCPPFTILFHAVDEIYLVGVCEGDEFVLFSFDVLRYLGNLMRHLIARVADEATIKAEFPTVYQVLDYAVDFGFPYLDEPNVISSVLTRKPSDPAKGVRLQLDLEHPWRSLNMARVMNGFIANVLERIDLIVSEQGRPEFCHVYGTVDCMASVSGALPQCKLRLTSGSRFEDATFHRCADTRSPEQKEIPFVPPFGSFRLMTYRNTTPHVKFPVWAVPVFKSSAGRFTFEITLKADASLKNEPEKVEVKFQLPNAVNGESIRILNGRWFYEAADRTVNWQVGSLSLKNPAVLNGDGSLGAGLDLVGKHAIVSVQFLATGITPSGFAIEDIEFPRTGDRVALEVRTSAKAGSYEFRTSITK